MKNKLKLVVISGLMAFPLMVAFQNCSRTVAMQITDEINSAKLDTDGLGNGEYTVNQPSDGSNDSSGVPDDSSVSQPVDNPSSGGDNVSSGGDAGGDSGSSGGGSGSGDNEDPEMNTQVEDPIKELNQDIADAPAECDYDANESQNDANGVLSEDGHSISHIRGSKVLSPADFNGASEVDEISDAYGKIVLCGLHVKALHDSGGRIILVNSEVDDLSQHKGDIGVLESHAIISESKGKLSKNNSDSKGPKVAGGAQRKEEPDPEPPANPHPQ